MNASDKRWAEGVLLEHLGGIAGNILPAEILSSDDKEGSDVVPVVRAVPRRLEAVLDDKFSKFDSLIDKRYKDKAVRKISSLENLLHDSYNLLHVTGLSSSKMSTVEFQMVPGRSSGFSIRRGNGVDLINGMFVSKVAIGGQIDVRRLFCIGDEIVSINGSDVRKATVEEAVAKIRSSDSVQLQVKSNRVYDASVSESSNTDDEISKPRSYTVTSTPPPERTWSTKNSLLAPTKLIKARSAPNVNVVQPPGSTKFGKNRDHVDSLPSPLRNLRKIFKSGKKKDSSYPCIRVGLERTGLDNPAFNFQRAQQYMQSDASADYSGELSIAFESIRGLASDVQRYRFKIFVDQELKSESQTREATSQSELQETMEVHLYHARVIDFELETSTLNEESLTCTSKYETLVSKLKYDDVTRMRFKETGCEVVVRFRFTPLHVMLRRNPTPRARGVFGMVLRRTLTLERNSVPTIVRKCIEEIERRGLLIEGIYRLSGSAKKKREIREQFDLDCTSVDVSADTGINCHVITGLLKDYLRELPEPLISRDVTLKLLEVSEEENSECELEEIMMELTRVSRVTLTYVLDHLLRVASHSDVNKMAVANLAVIFGPVLMCPSTSLMDEEELKFVYRKNSALGFLLNLWPRQVVSTEV